MRRGTTGVADSAFAWYSCATNTIICDSVDDEARYEQIEQQIPIRPSPRSRRSSLRFQGTRQNPALVLKYREYKKATEDDRALGRSPTMLPPNYLRAMAEEEWEQLAPTRTSAVGDREHPGHVHDCRLLGHHGNPRGHRGEEAALFARDLYEMYCRYAADRRWRSSNLILVLGKRRPPRNHFQHQGEASGRSGYEGGGHRVQRVPETEARANPHVGRQVAVLPEPEE